MQVRLERGRVIDMFRELGRKNPERWTTDRLQLEVKTLPDAVNEEGFEEPEEWSREGREAFNTILEAGDKEDAVEIVDESKQKNGHHAPDPKPEPRVEDKKEERQAKPYVGKPRGRPKGSGAAPKPAITTPHHKFSWDEPNKPRVLLVTKKLANEFRDMEGFPRDRDYSESRAKKIRKALDNHEFHGSVWATATCEKDGKTYRLNGKHTSRTISEWYDDPNGGDYDFYQVIREFTCPTMEDMADLHSAFDPRESARSKADTVRTHAAVNPATRNLSARLLSVLTTGLAFAEYESAYRAVPSVDQANNLLQNNKFVAWVADLMAEETLAKLPRPKRVSEVRHLYRMSVVAAMFRTWKRDRDAATEFWSAVRDDCDDTKESPRRVLLRFLMIAKQGAREGKDRVGEREMYVRCLDAWNAWRNGDTDHKLAKWRAKRPTPEVA